MRGTVYLHFLFHLELERSSQALKTGYTVS
jgi:hypothetical protein